MAKMTLMLALTFPIFLENGVENSKSFVNSLAVRTPLLLEEDSQIDSYKINKIQRCIFVLLEFGPQFYFT